MINSINILLADDDLDDCLLFKEALSELPLNTHLETVKDGEYLMQKLTSQTKNQHVLFLDLNMPCKNGIECLLEIKLNEKLKNLPIIILSTSFESEIVETLFKHGSKHYIKKPNEFNSLKKMIYKAILLIQEDKNEPTKRENFVINLNLDEAKT